MFISTGAAVNPVTGTNWERVGVKPDVAVPTADALARAQTLALDQAREANASTAPTEARWTLETLNAQASGVRLDPAHAGDYVGASPIARSPSGTAGWSTSAAGRRRRS